jgi:hypothetical protein
MNSSCDWGPAPQWPPAGVLAAPQDGPDIGGTMDRPAQEVRIGSGCVPNIGPTGRRLRYAGAAVAIAVGLVGAAQVIVARQSVAGLLAPALCFLAAAFGYYQAKEKT